jgi:hypothetical protein
MKYVTDVALAISTVKEPSIPVVRKHLQTKKLRRCTDSSDLRLAVNITDPSYRSILFYCRRGSSDPPRKVIYQVAQFISVDLQKLAHISLAAMIRRGLIHG